MLQVMEVADIVCLSFIIFLGMIFNGVAILFIIRKNSIKTLRDKIVAIMCFTNMSQSISYAVELKAAVEGT